MKPQFSVFQLDFRSFRPQISIQECGWIFFAVYAMSVQKDRLKYGKCTVNKLFRVYIHFNPCYGPKNKYLVDISYSHRLHRFNFVLFMHIIAMEATFCQNAR